MEEEYDSPSLRGLSNAQRVAISLIVIAWLAHRIGSRVPVRS